MTLNTDSSRLPELEEPSPDCSLHSDIPVPSCLPSQMCSPAQLRQESEELYAVIDKILEDGVPKVSELPVVEHWMID